MKEGIFGEDRSGQGKDKVIRDDGRAVHRKTGSRGMGEVYGQKWKEEIFCTVKRFYKPNIPETR